MIINKNFFEKKVLKKQGYLPLNKNNIIYITYLWKNVLLDMQDVVKNRLGFKKN